MNRLRAALTCITSAACALLLASCSYAGASLTPGALEALAAPKAAQAVLDGIAGLFQTLGVEEQGEASVGGTSYGTLAEAVAAAENGATVKLLSDVALGSTLTVGKDITLDLNGKGISCQFATRQTKPLVMVASNCKLVVDGGGSVTATGNFTFAVNGEATFKNCAVLAKQYAVLLGGNGRVSIEGARVEASASRALYLNSSECSAIVRSGAVEAPNQACYVASGTLTVEGGAVRNTEKTATNPVAIFSYSADARVTVTGGTVSGTVRGITNNGAGPVDMTGGTVTGGDYGVYNNAAGVVRVAGTAVCDGGYGIANSGSGTVLIEGGAVNGRTYGVYNAGGNVDISGGEARAETAALYSLHAGRLNVSGGKLGGQKNALVSFQAGDVSISGGELLSESGSTLWADGGSIDISGGSITAHGAMSTALYASKTLANDPPEVTVRGDARIVSAEGFAVSLLQGASFKMSDGSLEGYYYALANSGSPQLETSMSISGGSLAGVCGAGIYHPGAGSAEISGGTVSGVSGIEIRAGSLKVTGGAIRATGDAASVTPNGGGSTTGGAGIVVAQHTTKLPISVDISGGDISGRVALLETTPQKEPDLSGITLKVTGGRFAATGGEEDVSYIADGDDEPTVIKAGRAVFIEDCDKTSSVLADFISLGEGTVAGKNHGGWYSTDVDDDYIADDCDRVDEAGFEESSYVVGMGKVPYSITYDYGGGTAPQAGNPASYTREDDVGLSGVPSKAHYVFTGWTGEGVSEPSKTVGWAAGTTSGPKAYKANWELEKYTITWQDDNGTVLGKDTGVAYGTTPRFNGATPVKPESAAASYAFAGWSPNVGPASGDTVYQAVYSSTMKHYTVTYRDGTGVTLREVQVDYGTPTPACDKPSREGYSFEGWTPQPAQTVTGHAVYTATWKPLEYSVTWTDGNGGVLAQATCGYGQTPNYGGKLPVKEPADGFLYEFVGWEPQPGAAYADAVYTAVFTKKPADEEHLYVSFEGDGSTWEKGERGGVVLVWKRTVDDDVTFDHFMRLQVDGKDVESRFYDAVAGSVITTIAPEYLDGLAVGDHTVTAVFDDGNNPTAVLTVQSAETGSAGRSDADDEDDDDGEAADDADDDADDEADGEDEEAEDDAADAFEVPGDAEQVSPIGTGDANSVGMLLAVMVAALLAGVHALAVALRMKRRPRYGKHSIRR